MTEQPVPAVERALHPNARRCGTYPRILRAVHLAADLAGLEAQDATPNANQRPSPAPVIDGRATDRWVPRRPRDLTPSDEREEEQWIAVVG